MERTPNLKSNPNTLKCDRDLESGVAELEFLHTVSLRETFEYEFNVSVFF